MSDFSYSVDAAIGPIEIKHAMHPAAFGMADAFKLLKTIWTPFAWIFYLAHFVYDAAFAARETILWDDAWNISHVTVGFQHKGKFEPWKTYRAAGFDFKKMKGPDPGWL